MYWGIVTVYSSCVLGVQCLCILAVYWGYSDCAFHLCTGGRMTVFQLCTGGTVTAFHLCTGGTGIDCVF